MTTTAKVQIQCGRCSGTGVYTRHHGVCFSCGGAGVRMVSAAWIKAQATKAAKAQAAADEKAAATRAALAGKTVAELVEEQLTAIREDRTGIAPHKATDPAVIAEVTAWCEARIAAA